MKTFTENEVETLIKTTINETTKGFIEWLKNETHIIDKNNKDVLNNAEVDIKKDCKKPTEYIYQLLAKQGIIATKHTEKKKKWYIKIITKLFS